MRTLGRLAGVTALLSVGVIVAVFARPEAVPQESSGCRDVPPADLATFRRLIPADWKIHHAVYTTSVARTRSHDGAPVSFVAATIDRADGTPAEPAPGLWIIEGGVGPENERNPRGYFVYNDEAARITAASYTLDEEGEIVGRRRRIQDARLRASDPVPEGEPEAIHAKQCLMERTGEY